MKQLINKKPLGIFNFCLFLFFGATSIFSQNNISGIVLNEAKEPLAYATLLAMSLPDSNFITGTTTNEQGAFTFDIKEADILKTSSIGLNDKFIKISQTQTDYTIVLDQSNVQLDEITVTGKKPMFEQKIDRLVVNVANSITSSGGTALEVLERSPGVIVNKQWNTIALNGKEGVILMINGKVSRIPAGAVVKMLEGMTAENIEKIELIHTPPANFEAEGNGGIIHIVLKESADRGFNGTASIYGGYGLGEKYGVNANFNYRKKQVNLFGDFAYTSDSRDQFFDINRNYEFGGIQYSTTTISERDTRTNNLQARLGLDYQLSKKTILGVLTAWSRQKFSMNAFTTVQKVEHQELVDSLRMPSDEINRWQNALANINFQHTFKEHNVLNIDLDYVNYYFTNPSNYHSFYFNNAGDLANENQQRVRKKTPMDIWSAKADHRFKPNDQLQIETGLKLRTAQFTNDASLEHKIAQSWQLDSDFSSKVDMTEEVLATYASFNYQVHKNTHLKVGLRYEYTIANLGSIERPNIVDRQYGFFFPSAFFTQHLNKNNQFQASYSRRINRPDFTMLAPYFYFFDPTTLLTGDPTLQPSITDKTGLSYQWKTIQLQVNYSHTKEALVNWQISNDPASDVAIIIPQNFDYSKVWNSTLSVPFNPTQWLEIRNNISYVRQQFVNTVEGNKLSYLNNGWNYNGSVNFILPKKFSLEFSGFYQSKSLMGGLLLDPMSQVNFGLQKELSNNWGTLKFTFNDMFLGSNLDISQSLEENNFQYHAFFRMSARVFRLSYSLNFGNKKLKKARSRSTSSEEERKRVN